MTENLTDLPAACLRLKAKAEASGWSTHIDRVQAVYKDKPLDSVILKLQRGTGNDNVRLACMWEDGKFRTCLRQRPFGKLNSREAIAVVTG